MRKQLIITVFVVLFLSFTGLAYATNGDNLMGIGTISRSMGGVGIAAPQDPISAVFANPAAMCFGPYCPGSEFNFDGTIFSPTVHGKVEVPAMGLSTTAKSQSNVYLIPAIGISTPIDLKWRFGLAAYGVSGLGVDYRNELDINPATAAPDGDMYTQYQAMKFAPNIAYMINDNLSVGASIHIDYATLDLGSGSSHNYGIGVQLGTIYKTGPVSFGLSYVSPQNISHDRVFDFDGDGVKEELKLEMPQTAGLGIAFEPSKNALIEANIKWLNWADAKGYKDFDWENQWVYALGAQYKATPALTLRAGVNYGKSPVKLHDGFSSITPKEVQGHTLATGNFGYEYLRIIGFPAVAETHVTFGIGYQLTQKLAINLGYTHAFEKTISETGRNFGGPGGPDVTLTSDLSEDSIEFGLSWRF